MRSALLAVFALSFAAACQPQGLQIVQQSRNAPEGAKPAPAKEAAVISSGCDARVTRPWPINAKENLEAEAMVAGPTCATAVVTLVVRDKALAPLLAWAAPTQDVFGLYDAKDAEAMKGALNDFLDPDSSRLKTSADLPPWTRGKREPTVQNAEFPFHPDEGVDQSGYEDIRKAKIPVFAFPQGHESLAVYILRDGQLESVGVQQFPG
ncbi:MAG TPA: hypothetical protein VG942_03395 [Hyphomonadaceae bacterium]|nr:hypothetical protein [Hyphomonadaceae bacterium]